MLLGVEVCFNIALSKQFTNAIASHQKEMKCLTVRHSFLFFRHHLVENCSHSFVLCRLLSDSQCFQDAIAPDTDKAECLTVRHSACWKVVFPTIRLYRLDISLQSLHTFLVKTYSPHSTTRFQINLYFVSFFLATNPTT